MSAPERVRVAVVGATGYTGAELLRLLLGHPRVEVTALCAHSKLTPRASAVLPSLTGLLDAPVEPFDADVVARKADVAFCALPHGASIECVRALRERGVTVLDLSADFRLRDPKVYAEWYGATHAAPGLLDEAVYGLPELHREALRGAKLVAVPGCYPTASALPMLPLLARGIARSDDLVVHALSGVSGAGRTPASNTHLPECAEGVRSYKLAGTHRHTPEIEQTLSHVAGSSVMITFSPTLAPMTRGILSTVYARPAREDVSVDEMVREARAYFEGSPSVAVLDAGALPDTLWVRGSNRAHIAYFFDRRAKRIVAQCAIDNLVKGASGQAIQCMNLACGFDEGAGLRAPAMFP
ncbi:MAG: N-acetyl-gamma-glutamyl-phosphate reductase [Polyangiales bacterium]